MKFARPTPLSEGSALIAVFFLIAVLGMITFGAVTMLHEDLEIYRALRGRAYALASAESGLAIGGQKSLKAGDPLLYQRHDEMGFTVVITTEESRLNINSLILQPEQNLLKKLLRFWGIDQRNIPRLISTLKDWIDTDDTASLNGAEKRDYERQGLSGMPFNRPFEKLDDLLLVPGFEMVAQLYPGWKDFLTVYGDGKIDLNEAPDVILAFLAEIPMDRLEAFHRFRAGADGIFPSDDDQKVSSVAQLVSFLGSINSDNLFCLTQWGKFEGKFRRIDSIGIQGEYRRRLLQIIDGEMLVWRGEVPVQ